MAKLDLDNVSDGELVALQRAVNSEMENRKEEQLKQQCVENANVLKYMAKHKDVLLELMEHDYTSCSDEDPGNGGEHYRCGKCRLIELMAESEWTDETDMQVSLCAEFHKSVGVLEGE